MISDVFCCQSTLYTSERLQFSLLEAFQLEASTN